MEKLLSVVASWFVWFVSYLWKSYSKPKIEFECNDECGISLVHGCFARIGVKNVGCSPAKNVSVKFTNLSPLKNSPCGEELKQLFNSDISFKWFGLNQEFIDIESKSPPRFSNILIKDVNSCTFTLQFCDSQNVIPLGVKRIENFPINVGLKVLADNADPVVGTFDIKWTKDKFQISKVDSI